MIWFASVNVGDLLFARIELSRAEPTNVPLPDDCRFSLVAGAITCEWGVDRVRLELSSDAATEPHVTEHAQPTRGPVAPCSQLVFPRAGFDDVTELAPEDVITVTFGVAPDDSPPMAAA